jgi:hypothetical protein
MSQQSGEISSVPLTFEEVIASMRERIAAADDNLIMEAAGVAQALDDLRKALGAVECGLANREFEKAAALGYGSVSSGYVFLQRTLGGLQAAYDDKCSIVSEVAAQMGCAYEEALPHVNVCMESSYVETTPPVVFRYSST